MKCPFKKMTKVVKINETAIHTEEFTECYKEECPFYVVNKGKNIEICTRKD